MRSLIAVLLPLSLGGCLAKTAVDVVTLPVRATAASVRARSGVLDPLRVLTCRGDGGHEDADRVVDLEGALLLPAFVDAHLHVVQTGFLLTQLDLRPATSLRDALDAVGAFARADSGHDEVLVGTGWDDSAWPERRPPTAAELDRAAPGRRVLLTRLDGHSAENRGARLRDYRHLGDRGPDRARDLPCPPQRPRPSRRGSR